MNRRSLLFLALLFACFLLSAAAIRWPGRDADLLRAMERARPARAFAARLSIATEYRPCTPLPTPPDSTVPRHDCGPARAERSLANMDFQAAAKSSHPDSLRASAAEDLIWWDEEPESLDRAIARLEKALRLSRRRVPVLVDLSAAHLVRAERTQNHGDLWEALDLALRATKLDPRNPAALFNVALAAELIMLDDGAVNAWNAYLAVDSTSPWAEEARRRRDAIPRWAPPEEPGPDASEAEVDSFARQYPQEARLLGQEKMLGKWGAAVLAGHADSAAAFLDLAERLGKALESRNGDFTLSDLVRDIRAYASDARATRSLALSHREYAAGQAHFGNTEFESAAPLYNQVIALRPPSPVSVQWARAGRGAYLMQMAKRERADAVLRDLLAEVDSVRHPALVGRIHWIRGTNFFREGSYAKAKSELLLASRMLEHLGEREFWGFAEYLLGEIACQQRDMPEAYRRMHRALGLLGPYRTSRYTHTLLLALSRCVQGAGLKFTAELVQDEDVSVAEHVESKAHRAEAFIERARARLLAGREDQAFVDLVTAYRVVAGVNGEFTRKHLTGDVQSAAALLWAGTQPDSAARALDPAIEAATGNVVRLLPLLARRAELRLALGQIDKAQADLDSVTALIRKLSDKLAEASIRAGMIEEARNLFDQLVMLHVQAGDSVEALEALERGRVSFAVADERAGGDSITLETPPGKMALEYALIGDTLLTWVVRGATVHFHRDTLDRADFLRTVERVWSALESPERSDAAGPDLQRLYDWLIHPVRDHLNAPGKRLVILADGEIAGIPFDALLDRRTGRYLVENYTVSFAASLADAARPPMDSLARPASGLLIANPEFDRSAYPGLPRLGGASAEVASLAKIYPSSKVLSGRGATADSLKQHAPDFDFIHYAGHAVFDDMRPERSYLVLAGGRDGRMSADSITTIRLPRTRLVVLSACQTLRSREGRSGGFAGLSGALLAAGAQGVVGSLWRVSDQYTQPLMLEFHNEYSRTGDAADALRKAKIQMLRSDNAKHRSPTTWAGFRYAGS